MSQNNEPGMAYNMKKLNKVFAILSVLFLVTVVWVFLDDYLRPWKAVQIEAMKIRREKISEQIEEQEKKLDQVKLEKLQGEMKSAEEAVSKRKMEIAEVNEALAEVDKNIKNENIINGTLNAQVSALQFQYGEALNHHSSNTNTLLNKLQATKDQFAVSRERLKTYQGEQKVLSAKLAELRKEVINTEKEIKDMTLTLDLLTTAKSKTDLSPLFALRNSPFIDYLDPTLKVQQIVLKNITDDRYFQHVPKVDRCITCHTFIDQEGFEDQPNPHKTHPNLALMVGKDSPHPMKQTGCTSCHGGEGHRVNDFNSAAHIPQNEEQKQEWIAKYNWHEPHKVPQPMLKLQHTEASCVKCHSGVEYIPQATTLNEGRELMEGFGCYACHKIEGWEHKRKPGPSLERISSKVSKEFFKNWVWSPRSFNEHARMPQFFAQTNNSHPEFMAKNIAEVNAMAEFIYEKSDSYQPFVKYRPGNAEKGKELIGSIGCMGCHGVEGFEEESKKVDAKMAPYLAGTGSKITDADWLVSWLIKPSHYQIDTIMPSFRLSEGEANDIATYLLGLKNPEFEKLKFEPLDPKERDSILMDYLTAFDTQEVAHAKLSKMSDRERTLELGYRSVGKYGCYSCHTIEGFDDRAPIGPELTNEGSKPLTQFGFNLDHDVEHSRDGWIHAHLINPRRWDRGQNKPFKDLTKMPNFYMSHKQAEQITLALLGQVSDHIPAAGVKQYSPAEAQWNEGFKLVNKFNCTGCHQVDGMRGDILGMYEDFNEAPPWLVNEGHRVQTDWFYHFLGNVHPIRTYLNVRMPSYVLTPEERNTIVAGFQAKAEQQTFIEPDRLVVWAPGERAEAKALFDALACTTCHTIGYNSDPAQAPDLHMAKSRLRPSWIAKWLRNPQAIMPHTLMPNFWEGGEPLEPSYFGGDTQKQIDALTKYLIEIGHDEIKGMSQQK